MRASKTALVALVIGIALAAPTALATTTYSDTIGGYEYYATSTDGKFAGTATGTLPGSWNADVQHTALCISCSTTATITGGGLTLATALNRVPILVTGKFSGGTVQVTDPGANCHNQTFAVSGILSDVGPWHSGSASGTFDTVLTHYRHSIFGRCITYSASVTGTLTASS